MAENQSQLAKERENNKKIKIDEFQNKIKNRAKIIEKENKESREISTMQKVRNLIKTIKSWKFIVK